VNSFVLSKLMSILHEHQNQFRIQEHVLILVINKARERDFKTRRILKKTVDKLNSVTLARYDRDVFKSDGNDSLTL
jgi:hypothetical protein